MHELKKLAICRPEVVKTAAYKLAASLDGYKMFRKTRKLCPSQKIRSTQMTKKRALPNPSIEILSLNNMSTRKLQ